MIARKRSIRTSSALSYFGEKQAELKYCLDRVAGRRLKPFGRQGQGIMRGATGRRRLFFGHAHHGYEGFDEIAVQFVAHGIEHERQGFKGILGFLMEAVRR